MNSITSLFKIILLFIATLSSICHADNFPAFKFSLSSDDVIWEGILPSNQNGISFNPITKESTFVTVPSIDHPFLLTRKIDFDKSGYSLLLSTYHYEKSESLVQKMPEYSNSNKTEDYAMIVPIFKQQDISFTYSKTDENTQSFKFLITYKKDNHLFASFYTLTLSEIQE